MSGPAAIAFHRVTHTYRAGWRQRPVQALDGFSFAVPRGAFFGLFGPNGCGKTTAVKVLLGLVRPTAGEVQFNGRPIDRATRARLGHVAEQGGLPAALTGREVLRCHARLAGLRPPAVARRVAQVIEELGLAAIVDRRIGTLSKGQRQRIALGQALVHDPEVLVLDEPTSGLDAPAVTELRALLERLNRAGTTILLVAPLADELAAWCDTVALVSCGRVVRQDAPDSLMMRTDRQSWLTDALPPLEQQELAGWLAARGRRLHQVAPARGSLAGALDPASSD